MNRSMRTVDHADAQSHSLKARLARDWALAKRLLRMLRFYFSEGRRVRKAYAACEREGSTYWIDTRDGKRQ